MANNIAKKPQEIPKICGNERVNPKLTPELSNIMLFGPGVLEVTKANMDMDKSNPKSLFILIIEIKG